MHLELDAASRQEEPVLARLLELYAHDLSDVASLLAHELWRRHPGTWEVRIMERNSAALLFWQRAVAEFVGVPVLPEFVEVAGKRWHVFRLMSK